MLSCIRQSVGEETDVSNEHVVAAALKDVRNDSAIAIEVDAIDWKWLAELVVVSSGCVAEG